MRAFRDEHILILAAGIALAVGAFAGVAGSLLVANGNAHFFPRPFVSSIPLAGAETISTRFAEERATIDVVRDASPAVVSIVVRSDAPAAVPRGDRFDVEDRLPGSVSEAPRSLQEQIGGGSGFLVTSDGLVVTNRHVIEGKNVQFSVLLHDNREYPATILARDPVHDLAILKITAEQTLPVLALGDSDHVTIGETVIAIGYALSTFRDTVTKGVISGIGRHVVAEDRFGISATIDGALQTDAAINPGNSGGPLLNLRGEVVGVNTAVSAEGQLVAFAIPINRAKQAIESVIASGRIIRPWLGVRYLTITPELAAARGLSVDHGALLVAGLDHDPAVALRSPAAIAGLRAGDVILSVNGRPMTDEYSLSALLAAFVPGDQLHLSVHRGDRTIAVDVAVGEFPSD